MVANNLRIILFRRTLTQNILFPDLFLASKMFDFGRIETRLRREKHRREAPDYGRFAPGKELAYGEQNIRPSAQLIPPDYGLFAPGQKPHLRRTKRSAFGRIETSLRA